MPSVIRQAQRVFEAKSFADKFNAIPTTDRLYVGISGTSPWVNESLPPIPLDNRNEDTKFWNELIGLHKVAINDLVVVCPRITWTAGTQYGTIDPSLVNPWSALTYFVTSQNNVYRVLNAPAGVTSTIEPTHTGGIVTDAEGYTFEFLYTVSSYNVVNIMTNKWLPIEPTVSKDVLADLNAKYVLIRAKILDTDLPVNVTYRQIGLLINPLQGTASPGNPITATNVINTTPGTEIEIGSGQLVRIENRSPLTRVAQQSEVIILEIEF